MKKVYLFLENGMSFCGQSFGAEGEVFGELVFTTSMGSYLEILTDNCYYGQVVMQTFPLGGNYGIIDEDLNGKKPVLKAYIVREWCEEPSNFRCNGELDSYLKKNGIVGLCGIDTREITKILRNDGVMNCLITDSDALTKEQVEKLKGYRVSGAVESTASADIKTLKSENPKRKVVVWNFGEVTSICDELVKRDCDVTVVPFDSTADSIFALAPDGIVLSDGPGNPADNKDIISDIASLCRQKPVILGLGLGHQMLAVSQGADTHKLKHGHRGSSQPVIEKETGRIFITGQNHGYVVTTAPHNAKETYINVNDKTCEGLQYIDMPAYSLEFMPTDATGPVETKYMLDNFITVIDSYKDKK